jgi:hypothetical protein
LNSFPDELISLNFLKAEYIQALNEEEMARNELKAVTAQFEESKTKLENFKKQNEKAINLNLELSNILCEKHYLSS